MLLAALSLVLSASNGPLLFRASNDWVLVTRDGEFVRRIGEIAGVRPDDCSAVSPDGTRWAFSVRRPAPALYLWRTGDTAPRRVELVGDYAVTPSFSSDGALVFFAQNDPTLPHYGPMPFAQLWRVRFDSTKPERLTKSAGCHTNPHPLGGNRILFVHADCRNGTQDVEIFNGTESTLISGGTAAEVALEPSSGRIVLTRDTGDGRILAEWRSKDLPERIWTAFAPLGGHSRPAWASDGKSVLFQNGTELYRITEAGLLTRLMSLEAPN